jgi:RNA 2',3'-cyclic 3'-phosphodiesterase
MRAFVALELPGLLKDRLLEISELLYTDDARVNWVKQKNMHLTLKFLGDINSRQADSVSDTLMDIGKRWGKQKLVFGKLGAFPSRNRPKVIWVGIDNIDELSEIHGLIDDSTYNVGIERDNRGFSPHLTLGRVKDLNRDSELVSKLKSVNVETVEYEIDRLTLFKSELTKSGPIYTPVKSSILGG